MKCPIMVHAVILAPRYDECVKSSWDICIEKECAWWVNNDCVVKHIAESLFWISEKCK